MGRLRFQVTLANDYEFYLPLVYKPERIPMLGVHIEGEARDQAEFLVAGSFVRLWVNWEDYEESPRVYIWSGILERNLDALRDYKVILCVKNTPSWARVNPSEQCSPPKKGCFEEYANFLDALIRHCEPWGVEYYNEPEGKIAIRPDLISCFGDGYEGGAYYGELVKTISPYLKGLHPNVVLLAGALCGGYSQFAKGFLEWAQDNFDYLSFHGYAQYERGQTSWSTMFNKADEFKEHTNRPLFVTETSLTYDEYHDDAEQLQADYLDFILANAKSKGVSGVIWYPLTSNNWENSDLMFGSHKKPVYYVYERYLERA